MFQRKPRRFSRRSNYRGGSQHDSSNGHTRSKSNLFTNSQQRNNFRPSLSAEKMLEKYNTLAKEALSSGDRTLSENYLQHSDHFMRLIEDKNQSRLNVVEKPTEKEIVKKPEEKENNLTETNNSNPTPEDK